MKQKEREVWSSSKEDQILISKDHHLADLEKP